MSLVPALPLMLIPAASKNLHSDLLIKSLDSGAATCAQWNTAVKGHPFVHGPEV